MFRTFDRVKAGQKDSKQANTVRVAAPQNPSCARSRINQMQDFEDVFEDDSPFDMAPEMSIQLF